MSEAEIFLVDECGRFAFGGGERHAYWWELNAERTSADVRGPFGGVDEALKDALRSGTVFEVVWVRVSAGARFRLRATGRSNREIGDCEICGEFAGDVILRVDEVLMPDLVDGGTFWRPLEPYRFGHRECLVAAEPLEDRPNSRGMEVFLVEWRSRYTLCEGNQEWHTQQPSTQRPCEDCPEAGWYWRSPDCEPRGPFVTEAEALADAQEEIP